VLTADPNYFLDNMQDPTMPTMGAARYTGGLWVDKFLKTVT